MNTDNINVGLDVSPRTEDMPEDAQQMEYTPIPAPGYPIIDGEILSAAEGEVFDESTQQDTLLDIIEDCAIELVDKELQYSLLTMIKKYRQQAPADKKIENCLFQAVNSPVNKTVTNSLKSYGIYTLRDLSNYSVFDFCAFRFTNGENVYYATQLLEKAGLSWNAVSSVIINDITLNPILNPHASSANKFMEQIEQRYIEEIEPFYNEGLAAAFIEQATLLVRAIKKRINRAVNTLATVLVVKRTSNKETEKFINKLGVSTGFKKMTTASVLRMNKRLSNYKL